MGAARGAPTTEQQQRPATPLEQATSTSFELLRDAIRAMAAMAGVDAPDADAALQAAMACDDGPGGGLGG